MKPLYYYCILALLFLPLGTLLAQNREKEKALLYVEPRNASPYYEAKIEAIKLTDRDLYNTIKNGFPLTRDTFNKYPDSLDINGEIAGYTRGISCGTYCGCGTIKINLYKRPAGYPHRTVYLAVPCLSGKPATHTYNCRVYKLKTDAADCYWTEVPANKFDTRGLPFYTFKAAGG
jgi:hypothetical protein